MESDWMTWDSFQKVNLVFSGHTRLGKHRLNPMPPQQEPPTNHSHAAPIPKLAQILGRAHQARCQAMRIQAGVALTRAKTSTEIESRTHPARQINSHRVPWG